MARIKLTESSIKAITRPGRYSAECSGLALLVRRRTTGGISASWIQRARVDGKPTNVGLGPWPLISVKAAREMAMQNAIAIIRGEPIRFGGRSVKAAQAIPTFEEAADRLIAMRAPTWSGPRVERNWRSSLAMHVYPKIGDKAIDTVTTGDVIDLLGAIWHSKRSTAKQVRQRVSAVMEWARAHGYRADNPADGRIDGALPATGHRPEHHKALSYRDVPAAYRAIAAVTGTQRGAALGLMFLILTGARRDEARLAAWSEIDTDAAVWTIPGERTKTNRPHRVALSPAALAVLGEARALGCKGGRIFCGARGGALNESAFRDLLNGLGIECTAHGFRSSARDWAGDAGYPREVCEAMLAHVLTATEGAYRRGDDLDRRRPLMAAWSALVATPMSGCPATNKS